MGNGHDKAAGASHPVPDAQFLPVVGVERQPCNGLRRVYQLVARHCALPSGRLRYRCGELRRFDPAFLRTNAEVVPQKRRTVVTMRRGHLGVGDWPKTTAG